MRFRPCGGFLIGWWLAGSACFALQLFASLAVYLAAEEPPAEPEPVSGSSIPGAVGSTLVTFELLGRGMIPTSRVVLTNTSPIRVRLPRTWTYEVIPQPAILDPKLRSTMSETAEESTVSLKEIAYLPEQRVWLTMSERSIFGRSGQEDIVITPGRSWGHDHALDLRSGHFKPGPVFIRFCLGDAGPKSAWLRLLIPEVPNVPLLRFTTESRKLIGEVPFGRAIKEAGTSFIATATSGSHPWTRVLTLDPTDPLAALLPTLLLDGRSQQVFDDGVRCRFAVRGISATGEVDNDAVIVAVQPVE